MASKTGIPAFLLLVQLLLQSCQHGPMVVALQPIQGFPSQYTPVVAEAIDSVYGIVPIVLPSTEPYPEAFTNFKAPRYRADTILSILKRNKPDTINYVLGLTSFDICITKYTPHGKVKEPVNKYTDFGIFGLGYRPGPSSIVSVYRLGKEENILRERLAKVCVHELGHNFGLPHCKNKSCVMTDAVESIKTVDAAQLQLCSACKALLEQRM